MKFDKNKILTVVTADQAKVGQKGWFANELPMLKLKIERGDKPLKLQHVYVDSVYPFTGQYSENISNECKFLYFYPAPEPTYRPFKNAEEFKPYRDEWFVSTFPNGEQSHFKVIDYCDTGVISVGQYDTEGKAKLSFCTYGGMLKWATRENGEPCGVREEA